MDFVLVEGLWGIIGMLEGGFLIEDVCNCLV